MTNAFSRNEFESNIVYLRITAGDLHREKFHHECVQRNNVISAMQTVLLSNLGRYVRHDKISKCDRLCNCLWSRTLPIIPLTCSQRNTYPLVLICETINYQPFVSFLFCFVCLFFKFLFLVLVV